MAGAADNQLWLIGLLFLAVFWLDHGVRLPYTQRLNSDVR